jgi:hypothetical protein
LNFLTGTQERVKSDRIRINNFVEHLISSQLTYIFTAENPYNETVRYIREMMKITPELDILPIIQRHRMYFESKIKEDKKNVW